MQATTQIAEKLKDSGYNIARGPLYNLAVQLLGKSKGNTYVSRQTFIDHVMSDPDLETAFVRECALAYLMVVAEDMGGTAVVKPAAVGGGHTLLDTHTTHAPATSTEIGGDAEAAGSGYGTSDPQSLIARPAALQNRTPSQTAGGGQGSRDVHRSIASPSPSKTWSPDDVYVREYTRAKPGHAAAPEIGIQKPSRLIPQNKPRVSPADLLRSRTAIAKSVLDTVIVNGRPVGDIVASEALAWAEKQGRQARIVQALAHGVPPTARIRDYVDAKEAERRVKNLEASNAA